MALIVEDGSGVLDADAYVDVSYVDSYCDNYFFNDDWIALDNTSKERAIRVATQYIDTNYTFNGSVSNYDQALEFPRIDLGICSGRYVSSNEIPENVKKATSELAIRSLGELLFVDFDGTTGAVNMERKKLDVLEVEYHYNEYRGANSSQKKFVSVDKMLKCYYGGSMGSFDRGA